MKLHGISNNIIPTFIINGISMLVNLRNYLTLGGQYIPIIKIYCPPRLQNVCYDNSKIFIPCDGISQVLGVLLGLPSMDSTIHSVDSIYALVIIVQ